MREASKKLLKKLANGRPKPSKQTLINLFSDVQSSNIEELASELSTVTRRRAPARKSSPLETMTKSRLRKVGGKVKDFVPYLIEAAAARDPNALPQLSSAKSLNAKLAKIEELFRREAEELVDQALTKFTTENDVSYRLASV
ncbi:MAG: hypothetical protein AAGL97_09025 [Pseudomonadota bacterium]